MRNLISTGFGYNFIANGMTLRKEQTSSNSFQFSQENGIDSLEKKKGGVSVVWKNLSVTAELKERSLFKKTKHSYKKIIQNVTGAIFPGKLVAILGASGSGKTTLMSVLADCHPSGLIIEGDIKINGKSSKQLLKHISSFVYQHDLFIPTLTVIEHLNFVAKLRLDRNLSDKERKNLIFNVLKEVGLSHLAFRRIGDSLVTRGKDYLSGGEKKRLTVATELLTQPFLLFCDEPTTGLDSFSALKLMTTIQNMVVSKNRTVVCSIHQPNQQIFDLFDQIILMSKGKIMFNGSSSDAIQFFEDQGCFYDHQNPAEFLIKSITDKTNLEDNFDAKFSSSKYGQEIIEYVDNLMNQTKSTDVHLFKRIEPPSQYQKLSIVTHRSFLGVFRNSSIQNYRIIQKFFSAILLGLCLHGSITKTQPGLRAFQATAFVMMTQNFFPPCYAIMAHIPDQLPIFYREYSNSSNTPLVFYLANVFSLLPGFIFESLSFTLIFYCITGLEFTAFAVVMTCIVITLLLNASTTFGIFASIFCKTKANASSFAVPVLNCSLFTCGLFVKLSSLPYMISWIRYISPFTYACISLYIIQFKNVYNIKCESNINVRCLSNGHEVLESFGFDENSLIYNILMMILIYLILHLCAYLSLLSKIKKRNT